MTWAVAAAPTLAPLATLVQAVEGRLAAFYGFRPQTAAAAHLLSTADLHAALAIPAAADLASVVLSHEASGDLFIGIHFADHLVAAAAATDPLRRLDDSNLELFCLVVEEVSHFHLLLNRVRQVRPVSKLELECQAEIDKLLLAAKLLEEQCGDSHLLPLARRLYDGGIIVSAEQELYSEATRYAARFWFAAIAAAGNPQRLDEAPLRSLLRSQYDLPWAQRLQALATVMEQKAS